MAQNGKNKLYFRLSFYTIICTLVYAVLVVYLSSNHMLLRNKVNIIISFIIIILVAVSIFQNIVTKTKGNSIKLIIMAIIFLLAFSLTSLGNKYIIDNFLVKEDIREYNGEKYIIAQKGNETYYFKLYSEYVRSSVPKYSMSEMTFEDDGVKYITTNIVEFDRNGSLINTTSDTRTESGA